MMSIGQRVEIVDGVLKGEKATVVPHPGDGRHVYGGYVWIKFDRDNVHLGREQGYAILSQQWFEIERLRTI
jgi:hypothetical protein